jgi:hypothetical protein
MVGALTVIRSGQHLSTNKNRYNVVSFPGHAACRLNTMDGIGVCQVCLGTPLCLKNGKILCFVSHFLSFYF